MRGKHLKLTLACSMCLIIAVAFNNCSAIGEAVRGTASIAPDSNFNCNLMPAGKVASEKRSPFAGTSEKLSPLAAPSPMVSPFVANKISRLNAHNDYVALISHQCLNSPDNFARARFAARVARTRGQSTGDQLDYWPHKFSWEDENVNGDLEQLIATDPCVVGVSPNLPYKLTADEIPPLVINDTYFSLQDHLAKFLFNDILSLFYNLNRITDEMRPIKVAVIDTGAMYTHPDLAANMFQGTNGIGVDATTLDVEDQDPVFDGKDIDQNVFDGTHVSGIIAAVGGNALGVSGLAPQGIKIIPINVFYDLGDDDLGSDTATIAKAILWAISQNVDVINMSLGGPTADPALLAALQQAIAANVFIAAAAGNGAPGEELTANFKIYPGSYSEQLNGMVSVGSVDSKTTARSSFSHFSSTMVEIASYGNEGGNEGILSTFGENLYARLRGTSQASPQVAAAGAMLMGLYQRGLNRKPTPAEVENLLMTTAKKVPALAGSFRDGNVLDPRAAALKVYSDNAAAFNSCPP